MQCHQEKQFTKGITVIKDAGPLNKDCSLQLICPNRISLCHVEFQLANNF